MKTLELNLEQFYPSIYFISVTLPDKRKLEGRVVVQ